MSDEQSITHIRPRFRFTIDFPKNEVLDRLKHMIEDHQGEMVGYIVDNHITMDINEKQRHYWSPQLSFRVEEDYDNTNRSVVRGLVGPRPSVWTMFMFIYFSIGTLGVGLAIYGVTQKMLGESGVFMWALPAAILFMLTAYKAGKMGENLGADQIETLKQFVRDALEMKKPGND